jgi:hypothetical protein
MAEDKVEPREVSLSQRLPWLAIFQGFRVALDFNKLVLAAAGIIVMAFGWWLLAVLFNYSEPDDVNKFASRVSHLEAEKRPAAMWEEFRNEHQKWALMYEAAGDPSEERRYGPADFASTRAEYEFLKKYEKVQADPAADLAVFSDPEEKAAVLNKLAELKKGELRPAGKMRVWPWSEYRGGNPYLLVTGQSGGWQKGGFADWLLHSQVPVLLEPLVKMIRPIVYFFHPYAGALNSFYCLLVLFWTVVTWAIFGGAITRIAAVQIARKEKITMSEAIRFTTRRWVSFVTAPLFPLLFVGFLLVFMVIFGLFAMLPIFGDIFVSGLLWWIMLIFGILMAIGLIGLIGWPLMSATISTEGTDSWEAVSRSYSYVFQAPWYYLWCGVVSLLYGAIVVFFVGFIGSFAVYLSKWGVSQTPWIKAANRDPSYLFVYAPKSFGWRDLMLKDATIDGTPVVNPQTNHVDPIAYEKYLGNYEIKPGEKYESKGSLSWWNKIGAVLVAVWIYFFFLLILGFGYSFFWSASTIVYFLMRKRVDDAEMDEVYLEEDDADSYQGPLTSPAPAPAPPGPGPAPAVRVEPPTLRQPTAPPAPAPAAVPAPPPPAPPPPPVVQAPPPAPAPEPHEPLKPPEPPPSPPANS